MRHIYQTITLAHVIHYLDPAPYSFHGHCWAESTPTARTSISFNCEFTHDGKALVADWQQGSFELRIPFGSASPSGAIGTLFVRGFGHIQGQITFSDGHVLFFGCNEAVTIFAHVGFDDENTVTVTGTYEFKGKQSFFSLNGSVDHGPSSIANIQSIAKKRA